MPDQWLRRFLPLAGVFLKSLPLAEQKGKMVPPRSRHTLNPGHLTAATLTVNETRPGFRTPPGSPVLYPLRTAGGFRPISFLSLSDNAEINVDPGHHETQRDSDVAVDWINLEPQKERERKR